MMRRDTDGVEEWVWWVMITLAAIGVVWAVLDLAVLG